MVKQRNVGVCLLLSIVTCGIYGVYWFICLTDDTNEVTESPGTSGIMSLILLWVTCYIYGWFWAYKLGEKMDFARARNGAPNGNLALLFLVLCIFGFDIIVYAIAQNEINKYVPA